MIYKMLALNIDGTLLQDNGRLNKATKEAIELAIGKGIKVTLVTSRNFSSATRIARELHLDTCLVTHQGSFVARDRDKPILVKRINENVTHDLVRFLEAFNCQIKLVHERYTIANKQRTPSNLMGKFVIQPVNRFSYSETFVDSLLDKLIETPVSPPKIEVRFMNDIDMIDAKKAIQEMFHEVDCIENDEHILEIVPNGTSKLKGVLYLCDRLNIQRDEVVMIGSGKDDLPLIEWSGLGVAMGNASPQLKRAADWITRSNNENGVSYMVKEHFRKQQPIDFLKKMNVIK
ncbi:Cof-type HAD-IIB family hydrolase [Heyndrickxia oleronia]|uniref:Cof-type HAD-IIB family hydrolase n=1 Tax=Heyndrickxia oleronia TaxID=38875 RepID=A0A8E2I9M6_9BACI|nr:Cof-type HAD-IIB family hydrolase [Heyndrickxia oleronia]NYV66761.1 Cof-type HAD-IIB family hydrolase [Bacillus sp. Gen3]OJH17555.1 haloacid dehalogenase [Bacillus obstructivus]MBU5211865.1 Cof-type HAD-IIB family hydrolase [Heyndrickxia oleronia]MCM3238119.1 Cof-type HAD-IIB family hydrolase [Heyndrickxia oleronia]MCM3456920.1 Cof-type HAD-IIB family hydrolase [Heyndrickxia oleronia]